MSNLVQELTLEQANDIINGKSTGLVVIDFWAPWCNPCVSFSPTYEKAASLASDVKFVKLNVQDYREFALTQGIRSIPTFFFYKDGQKVDQVTSTEKFPTAEKLVEYVRSL